MRIAIADQLETRAMEAERYAARLRAMADEIRRMEASFASETPTATDEEPPPLEPPPLKPANIKEGSSVDQSIRAIRETGHALRVVELCERLGVERSTLQASLDRAVLRGDLVKVAPATYDVPDGEVNPPPL